MPFSWKTISVSTVILMAIFVAYLPLSSPQGVFNTPDENANNYFSLSFAKEGLLQIYKPIEEKVGNAIHPRGVNVVKEHLVPESFIGLPVLHGFIARLNKWIISETVDDVMVLRFSSVVILILITIFALKSLYILFLIFFSEKIARLSFLLVLSFPIFLYWAGRPMMHTIIFLDLAIIGWIITARSASMDTRWDMLSGVLIGIAIAVRSSELIWVCLITAILVIAKTMELVKLNKKKTRIYIAIAITRFVKIGFGFSIVIVSLLFLNQDLYGNFFGTGYSITEADVIIGSESPVPQLSNTPLIKQIALPFGFHPIQALQNFVRFGIDTIWWYAVPMLLGAIVVIGKSIKKRKIISGYVVVWSMLSIYLILFYGAFNADIFSDPLHPLEATVGAPHLRYWLPIYIFGAPLVAYFFLFIKDELKNIQYGMHIISMIFILMIFFSIRTVVWAGAESWNSIRDNLWNFKEEKIRIASTAPQKSLFIIPKWADRIYFPERDVIMDVEGKDRISIINNLLVDGTRVFWLRGRGEIKLEPDIYDNGLKLERRFDIDPKGKIYEVKIK